jgi:uncharacterized membrane protein YdbT with pleckstrin-like domain
MFVWPALVFVAAFIVAPDVEAVKRLMILASIGMLVGAAIRYWTTEIGVTDRRIIVKRGLIARRADEMRRDRVETIVVGQSIPGRILNYGTVTVRGTGGGLSPVRAVAAPLDLRTAIGDAAAARMDASVA